MTIDLTLLGNASKPFATSKGYSAEVDALRSELQAQRAELQAQRVDGHITDLVGVTAATGDAVSALAASMDASFAETHRQMTTNLEVVLQAIEHRS